MELDQELLADSMKSALRVEFLANSEELFLYAGGLYSAMMWSREVDRENLLIQERDKSLK